MTDLVERAVAEVNGRFPEWTPTPAMFGYARAVARAALEAAGVPLLTKELRDLATALHRQHYAHVKQWKPLDDPRGILSQIDNMAAGMRDTITALQARVEKLEGALRGIAFAVRHGTETDVQAWANLANACQQTARAALAEDYCGIVEGNEEDFKAKAEKGNV